MNQQQIEFARLYIQLYGMSRRLDALKVRIDNWARTLPYVDQVDAWGRVWTGPQYVSQASVNEAARIEKQLKRKRVS